MLLNICICCRAKKDMDRQEFMFFLTGGVGLENKVRNSLYPVAKVLSLLHSFPILTHPGCPTSPGMRFVACATCMPLKSLDSILKIISARGRSCTMIVSPTQLRSLSPGMKRSQTFKR